MLNCEGYLEEQGEAILPAVAFKKNEALSDEQRILIPC